MNGGLPRLRVERARLRVVELPLVSPFTTSFGTQTVRRALLVELEPAIEICLARINPTHPNCLAHALGIRPKRSYVDHGRSASRLR